VIFEQFYLERLAQVSYLVGSNGVAAVRKFIWQLPPISP